MLYRMAIIMKDYVEKFTELRIDRDITQKQVATILGINQSAYSKYEKRRTKMSVEDFKKLCVFYQVSADEILDL